MKNKWYWHAAAGVVVLLVALVLAKGQREVYTNAFAPSGPTEKIIVDKSADFRWATMRWILTAEDGSWTFVSRAKFKQIDEGETFASSEWRTD